MEIFLKQKLTHTGLAGDQEKLSLAMLPSVHGKT